MRVLSINMTGYVYTSTSPVLLEIDFILARFSVILASSAQWSWRSLTGTSSSATSTTQASKHGRHTKNPSRCDLFPYNVKELQHSKTHMILTYIDIFPSTTFHEPTRNQPFTSSFFPRQRLQKVQDFCLGILQRRGHRGPGWTGCPSTPWHTT